MSKVAEQKAKLTKDLSQTNKPHTETNDKWKAADSYINSKGDTKESNEDTPPQKEKVKRHNPMVRNSLSVPKSDYDLMDSIINRCMKKTVKASRMEVIRAAVQLLSAQDDKIIIDCITNLPPAGKQGKKTNY